MLDFNEVNSWINSNIKGFNSILDVTESAVSEAISLYDKQTDEFKASARKMLANSPGKDIIDFIGNLSKPGYDPNTLDYKSNGVGCVLLSSDNINSLYRMTVCLVVPNFYCMVVKLELDRTKKVTGGGVVYKNYYKSPHVKNFVYSTASSGEVLDNIFSFKEKVDNNQRLDP